MNNEKHKCPHCGSVDTVSYWDIKGNREEDHTNEGIKLSLFIHRRTYPNARKCVDCKRVTW
jgi:hypothetical protein